MRALRIWIIPLSVMALVFGLFLWLTSESGESQQRTLELYDGIALDATLLRLDKQALDEAYHNQLVTLFGVWLRQQAGAAEAENMRNGLRLARRAYNQAAQQIARREQELQHREAPPR